MVFLAGLAVVTPRGPREDSTALRRLLLAFAAGVFCCYVFYTPFDAWWYLRFVLPAFPAIFVLAADALCKALGGSDRSGDWWSRSPSSSSAPSTRSRR
jgi:hypothetical protein